MSTENQELAVILMGSASDKKHGLAIAKELKKFGIKINYRVGSAHTTPWHLLNIIREYENQNQNIVFITVAGRSDGLSAIVCGQTRFPVIAAPPKSEFGLPKYLSSIDVPSGVGPALTIYPGSTAVIVAKIFALNNPEIARKITVMHDQTILRKRASDKLLKSAENHGLSVHG